MSYTMMFNIWALYMARAANEAAGIRHLEISPLLWVVATSLGLVRRSGHIAPRSHIPPGVTLYLACQVGVVCATDWAEANIGGVMFAKQKK